MEFVSRTGRRIHRSVAGWRRCSWQDRRVFLLVSMVIPAMAMSLRLLSFQRTMRWIERSAADSDSSSVTAAAAETFSRAIRRARACAPYRGNCLSTSLALYWLLLRRGVAAEL